MDAPRHLAPIEHLVQRETPSDDLRQLPARPGVCVLLDKHGKVVVPLALSNLRSGLQARWKAPDSGSSRRVDLRAVVRKILWFPAHCQFETDLLYLQVLRSFVPESVWPKLPAAWFVEWRVADPTPHPIVTRLPSDKELILGPFRDERSASQYVEAAADWFDFCRYPRILARYPDARACAYKDMHRCPAPCDGSVSMDAYRQQLETAFRSLAHPADFLRSLKLRMDAAAADYQFESAGRIRSLIETVSKAVDGKWKHVAPLQHFRYVVVQKSWKCGVAVVLAIDPTRWDVVAVCRNDPRDVVALHNTLMRWFDADSLHRRSADPGLIGVASQDLLSSRRRRARWISLDTLTPLTLQQAIEAEAAAESRLEHDDNAQ